MALATRWHGTTSREPPVYSGEAGTRKRREFGAPSLPASRAKEQPGTSKAGWGLPGVCWKGILAPLPRPGLARAGRAAPNNSGVWGGSGCRTPGEEERGVLVSPPLLGHSRRLVRMRIAGLEPSQLQPGPAGAGTRRVPVPPPRLHHGQGVVVRLRVLIPTTTR